LLDRLKNALGLGRDLSTSPTPEVIDLEDRLVSEDWERDDRVSGPYFSALGDMDQAISRRDFAAAATAVRASLELIPAFVESARCGRGSLPPSIPALERGGTMLALIGDRAALTAMVDLVKRTPELVDRVGSVEAHMADLETVAAIEAAVHRNPGCPQTQMKTLIGATDGRRVSNLIAWLEKAGRISRKRSGSYWTLHPPASQGAAPSLPKRRLQSHRHGKPPLAVLPLELEGLPYVSLPRAPFHWEERREGRMPEPVPEINQPFELLAAPGWTLDATEKIPMSDRPDTAFRRFMAAREGLFLVDDLGKANAFPEARASTIRYGRAGEASASGRLHHDVYRLSTNPLGRGLIAMSRMTVVHAYDDDVRLILETALEDAPEIEQLLARTGPASELRTFIRAVALAPDADRYLVTAVDEVWCYTLDGQALWGRRLPRKEGWSQIAEPGGVSGTSEDVQDALELMDLKLPVSSEDVKRRYRELAKQWHPDRNPNDALANERMIALTNAAELLTGVDADALGHYTGALIENVISRIEFGDEDLGISFSASIVGGETEAADWIYAAAFAGTSREVFVAGYSGKVIHLNEVGAPLRVYDIGSVPRSVSDTGDYLYILTDTRLYVLQGEVLHALIDTLEAGEIIVGETGFALIEKRRLRWFRENGDHLGTVITKEPIRRAYHTGEHLVVETRQRRARIAGAPSWWE